MPEPILRPWNYSWTCGEMRCGGGLRDGEKFHGKLRKMWLHARRTDS